MSLSVLDIFKIGIGPSSSHTVGPMNAARHFVATLAERDLLDSTCAVEVALYGSLALTGAGHATDRAVLLGLAGHRPESIEADEAEAVVRRVNDAHRLVLKGTREIEFDRATGVTLHKRETLPRHTNGMRFTARDADGAALHQAEYYSLGGGFIVCGDESQAGEARAPAPFEFDTAGELLEHCRDQGLEIHELMAEREKTWASPETLRTRLLELWEVMQDCVRRGFSAQGLLPGVLKVRRRAPKLYRQLQTQNGGPLQVFDWVDAWALAVNEENAAGGRVVTAPTNGAAGIIPAVLHYYGRFEPGADEDGVIRFLLTAGAIAMLYKKRASLSGAEMGCQGEVGVACSMAAAGLVSALHGSNAQIENAAEIGMEHNLGLTCDPVAGLVQIPCIERNAMGSVKAINAARLALRGDGTHKVSLDQVIRTMRQTGRDMSTIYKETSEGGLAVNVPEC
ncbi:MAG: L-serine ammonia-lyase [Gammaproteobacteria bacterium]|nr:MAG: L-serine ammonia-lyase [Gammaproteobacteria bacterium]